jgi:hypothetical protein
MAVASVCPPPLVMMAGNGAHDFADLKSRARAFCPPYIIRLEQNTL